MKLVMSAKTVCIKCSSHIYTTNNIIINTFYITDLQLCGMTEANALYVFLIYIYTVH